MRPITEDAFWGRFMRDDCWEWTMALDRKGYGILTYHRAFWKAHRLAWTLTVGPIQDGLTVCHACDNRRCGRVDGPLFFDDSGHLHKGHLWLGTNADNTYDMIAKGRAVLSHPRFGVDSPSHKLTEDDVREIRRLRDGGATTVLIAAKYNISDSHVSRIVKRHEWSHI